MESTTRLVRSDNMVFRMIGEEGVVYDPVTKQLHLLNQTALLAWNLWDGKHSLAEIVSTILSDYDAGPEEIMSDVISCASELCRLGLLKEAA